MKSKRSPQEREFLAFTNERDGVGKLISSVIFIYFHII